MQEELLSFLEKKQLEARHYIRVANFTLQQINGIVQQQQQQIGVQLS